MPGQLEREEYIEQAHLFRSLGERVQSNMAIQDVLAALREEALSTTKLPLAIDYMLAELKHGGVFAPAMRALSHYFTEFQAYLIEEAENERGRFDLRIALEILHKEAAYRATDPHVQGIFLYQFEALCRNRLRYGRALQAMASDPVYNDSWQAWILDLRRQIGLVDVADMIYVQSEHYQPRNRRGSPEASATPHLFGAKEGRIALANRRKDPLLLFSALHRQLGYPAVPRPKPAKVAEELLPQLARRMERMEQRMKLVEEELKGGIDLSRYFRPPDPRTG